MVAKGVLGTRDSVPPFLTPRPSPTSRCAFIDDLAGLVKTAHPPRMSHTVPPPTTHSPHLTCTARPLPRLGGKQAQNAIAMPSAAFHAGRSCDRASDLTSSMLSASSRSNNACFMRSSAMGNSQTDQSARNRAHTKEKVPSSVHLSDADCIPTSALI
ncbi:hypothetical protein NDU88_005668 [Pleurodeles waltl]|uniref:Uncharacterized protein n=1 Tax=Pleurodeles waltl TaxID=8319 RepID=A0AAV7VP74_PLEWA|nr:hypothetical protein NDU88_005668 [Pleurodeles waltl]